MKIKFLWVALLWLLVSCQSPPTSNLIAVKVDRAISGNAIELQLAGQMQRVRLAGVNSPGFQQKPWGTTAKEYLEEIIQSGDHQFTLELEPINPKANENYRYGYLWRKQVLINEELVRAGQGLAVTRYIQPKYERQLVRAQAYARLMGLGIWSHDAPLRNDPSNK